VPVEVALALRLQSCGVTTVSTTPGPTAIGADDKELASGQDVGEYRIENVIGRGGFGTVYGAAHPVIGKRVAIKVLARKYAADQAIVSRFAAEARAVNQIRHRNIIDIFSFGQLSDGRHYYVMEYLDGEPLDVHIRKHGAMPLAEAIPILRAIARALDAAHAKGIAHRDLKPENIFLASDPDGGVYPKLLDFGIAKLLAPEEQTMHRTGTGVPIGTPYYMSPEQCRGRDVDHRTDIYSFGIVIYRLLTGTLPFEADDYVELLFKQVNEEPSLPTNIKPELPPSVDIAIAWMMQKDRDKRPVTVLDGVNALDPSASFTPSIPPTGRGSRPSVSRTGRGPNPTPRDLALAETGISSPNALAETRPSDAAVAPLRKRGYGRLVAGLGILVVGGGVAYVIVTRGSPAKPAPSAATTDKLDNPIAPTPTLPPAAVADAAAHPEHVELTFVGVPDGAEVLQYGKPLGITPKVKLSYGTTSVDLVLQLDGYHPLTTSVTPDRDQDVALKMKPKKRATSGGDRPRDKDDVESPFNKKH